MRRMNYDFISRRSMVLGQGGMVAANNPLAAQAGLDVLRRGGNAADAAVATAAMLNVTDPASTGIGGDMFALYYDAKSRTITALNGSGRAPAAASISALAERGITGAIPDRSVYAITVPGACMGWHDLLARHGRMGLADVLRDPIHYARDGYPVHSVFGDAWAAPRNVRFLAQSPNTEDYLPGGKAPKVGQVVKLPGLARTFQLVAEGGPAAYYEGPIAEAIVSTVQSLGGLLTLDDLKAHCSTWDEPISTTYRGVTIHECPPNGQGLTALIAMNIAEGFDLAAMPWDSPERLHLMVEAMRLAFADARHYIADPAHADVPTHGLLDKGYAAQRRALISADHAMQPPSFGMPPDSSDTVYLCTADGEGNACSFINSLYMGFGTGIVAKGYGVFLQNRGANFVLEPGHRNALEGGKRPYHTIIPGMATRADGSLFGPFGVMGGFMQPQGHFQVVSGMIDDVLNPQEALDRPRWCLSDGTGDSVLALEDGISFKTAARLASLGHNVRPVTGDERSLFGCGQIIIRDPETGVLYGGCDPRKDSVVAVF
ncbi:MAG: Glutathione hydrolase-like YwrD proenzyme [Anaerolineae bacterium]|jgi:gamma-glutamyltranspeptidase/glutathione hydrolase|nr:MAG: putative gamma-glutamyltranspeptidase [Chloroflexi bacterium OLB13]MBV6437348.1 Glutathione hydrolase-like YwrD proenzyme [Anaerolineae bacterium]GIK28418.1 MAG: gamma-glutamyltranspeptidase [Chloroflexota bacterium]